MMAARTMAMMNMILMPVLILRSCFFAFTASKMKSNIDTLIYIPTAAIKANTNTENKGPNKSRDDMMNLLQVCNLSLAIVIIAEITFVVKLFVEHYPLLTKKLFCLCERSGTTILFPRRPLSCHCNLCLYVIIDLCDHYLCGV